MARLSDGETSGVLRQVERLGASFEPLTHPCRPHASLYADGGLNFEHIFNGSARDEQLSWFTPRTDPYTIVPVSTSRAVVRHDGASSAWGAESEMTYTVADGGVDLDFRIRFGEDRFPLGYAALMWASYMRGARDRQIHFLGSTPDGPTWMRFGEDADGGLETGTVAAAGIPALPFEEGAALLNVVEHPVKCFARPFYYGLLEADLQEGLDLAYVMMFDQVAPIRFAMWNFAEDGDGSPDSHRPAWDWQFVIREPQVGEWYGYRARMQCMAVAAPGDVQRAYESWHAGLPAVPSPPN